MTALAVSRPRHLDAVTRLARYAGVGGAATVMQGVAYAALAGVTSAALPISYVASTLAATAAHARITFGASRASARDHAVMLAFMILAYLGQERALAAAQAAGVTGAVSLGALIVAVSAVFGLARFLLLRLLLARPIADS